MATELLYELSFYLTSQEVCRIAELRTGAAALHPELLADMSEEEFLVYLLRIALSVAVVPDSFQTTLETTDRGE